MALNSEMALKLSDLREAIRRTGGCAVAYSGGVDSSLVLAVAHEVLGERALAVIAISPTYARRECEAATEWCRSQGIPFEVIESDELTVPGFRDNPPERCYYCKRELFTQVWDVARRHGLNAVADGTNADDAGDFRPGMRAARDLAVIGPLKEAGLGKDDIRFLAREVYHLPMADKPAMACMASRFPYGSRITREKLQQVERIENLLAHEGFRVYRARHHGDTLRLELGADDLERMFDEGLRRRLVQEAKSLGFVYVTLDLEGYRTGRMNEPLRRAARRALASNS